ncbi:MAG: alpha/beta hydrolase [Oscillospiraceae bacterium]|nr:alpha/beta hydrolase [Oscillospiraceae bacterium]
MGKNKAGWLLAGGVLGALGIGAGIGSAMLFSKTLPRPQGTSQDIIDEFADKAKFEEYKVKMAPVGEWMAAQKLENVYIISRDGLKLHAFYIAAEEKSDRVVILHHGFTSHAVDNSSHAKFFHEQGYEVLLLDLRAHGESEGQYVGFGILDRFDTLEWIKYARERFGEDVKIVLHGTSMGGATVLMALGLPEVQNSVSAVIADCAYTSPAEIFSHVIEKDYHIPPAPIIKLNGLYSQPIAGYRFDEYSTVDALKDNKVPVLFIHGKEDKFVPTWMSQKNYDACSSKKRLLFVENAGHGSSNFENPELYEKTEKEFLSDVLGE